ncbi:MAG: TMEM175 family protein [bacterium]
MFAASFFLVGIYWVAHKNEGNYLTRTDRIVDWLNLVFLATVALLPFSVWVLAGAWHAQENLDRTNLELPVLLYLGNAFLGGIALSLFFGYVAFRNQRGNSKGEWLSTVGKNYIGHTIFKNLAIPLISAMVFGLFKVAPQVVWDHFLVFMALPPALYFVYTIAVWGTENRKRFAGHSNES